MKISIILTIYNVAPYLRRGLDSVLAAAEKMKSRGEGEQWDVEVICVDDGATDGSGQILDEYSEKVAIIHQENTGISIARQHGLDRATGDWIMFADPDDVVDKDFVRAFSEAISSHDVDMVWCDYFREQDGVIRRVETRTANDPGEHLKAILEDRIWGVVFNKAYRRSFIVGHGIKFLNERHNGLDDLYFNSHFLSKNPRIAWIDACNYHYMIRSTSITGSGWNDVGLGYRASAYAKLYASFRNTPYGAYFKWRQKRLKFYTYLAPGVSDEMFAKTFPEIKDIDDVSVGIWHKVLFRVATRGGRSYVIWLMKVGRFVLKMFKRH